MSRDKRIEVIMKHLLWSITCIYFFIFLFLKNIIYFIFLISLETKPGLLIINNYLNQINPDLQDVQSDIKEVV